MKRKLATFAAALAVALPVTVAATTQQASALSGCGLAQYTYTTRAWCADLNQSIGEWVRGFATCSATGSTRYYGPKIYTDGGSATNNYSESGCGLGTGTVTSSGATSGHS